MNLRDRLNQWGRGDPPAPPASPEGKESRTAPLQATGGRGPASLHGAPPDTVMAGLGGESRPMGLAERRYVERGESRLMGLDERRPSEPGESRLMGLAERRHVEGRQSSYSVLKGELYRQLVERIDLDALNTLEPARLKEELRLLVERLLQESGMPFNAAERRQVVRDIEFEVLGFGPLEPLLADETVSDILVNNAKQVYIERRGRLELSAVTFDDDKHLMKIIDKIVSRVGRRIDESSPMVDARLHDGSRVNAIIPPLALDGPVLSIRKFSVVPLKMENLVGYETLTPEIAELLAAMVRSKLNILISGGTGSGKTTMLNILSGYIPEQERVVTIEDAAELQLQQTHVVRLETRPPNMEGKGEVTQRALVKNALRMRPDRVILGEVRGDEAFDMLQAMNTGHEGSMATIHANTARDAVMRLENMISMAASTLTPRAARLQIASALTAVLQIQRLSDGRRKLMSLTEIIGMEGETLTMQDIFVFQQTGVNTQGQVAGQFRATGVRPRFQDRLRAYGQNLSDGLYDPARVYHVGGQPERGR